MPRDRDTSDEIFSAISEDTIKRAEEMCAALPTQLGLERRGQTTFYKGAITDLDSEGRRFTKVTIAESGKNSALTIISEGSLPETSRALLVYRLAPGNDLKYLGRHKASRAGKRQDDPDNMRFTVFEIIRDMRKG